jgi:hypothetical protein
LVVDRPVDSELTPLCAVLMPVDVDVDNVARLLSVVDSPVDSVPMLLSVVDCAVDSESMLLCVVLMPLATVPESAVDSELMPVDVDVDSVVSWPTFTASVGFTPAATLDSATGAGAPVPPSVTFVWPVSSY